MSEIGVRECVTNRLGVGWQEVLGCVDARVIDVYDYQICQSD